MTLKEFLEIFFSEWFLNWPEPSLLTGFEQEAAEHWHRKVIGIHTATIPLLMYAHYRT